MYKVFLSHSSKDKDFVRKVAERIGLNFCVIDECEFEAGMKNIDEIFRGIGKSDIFVYFISANSLESEWVKKELNIANEKVDDFSKRKMQIFPILIDESITHTDERIAEYLRIGDESYNLRHMLKPELVARKIRTQLVKLEMDLDRRYEEKKNYFYGRDEEKLQLKRKIDDVMNEVGIRCVVVAGIPGIGRKSFAVAALKDAGIIEKYYFPITISLNRDDSIDNILRGLNNQGIGKYSINEISMLKTLEDKIEMLTEMLIELQNYQEVLVIDDSACIINMSGNMSFWFEKAISKMKSKLSIVVISEVLLDEFRYKSKAEVAYISLKEMSKSDTLGMLRTYSKLEGIPFEKEDREFLSECLSGYPPQIQYCVALAQQEGIDYVKRYSYKIVEMPEQVSSKLINLAYNGLDKNIINCLLALIAQFGTMPVTLMNQIICKREEYKDAFYRLRALSVFYYVGNEKEYIKLNSFLQNFVERNKFEVMGEIQDVIKGNIAKFESNIVYEDYTDELDYTEINYYVKELLKEEKSVPERFLYGTVFLQSLISLYKDAKYSKVIKIVSTLIENNQMISYERDVEYRIKYYYCLALIRQKSSDFENVVTFFSEGDSNYVTYNFLKGYNNRIRGDFEQAERYYLNVLRRQPNDMKTLREIVFIYVSTQRYDTAISLARSIYKKNKNNIYYMQAYFECLVYKKIRSDEEEKELEEIVDIVRTFYEEAKPNSMYYQILGKYEAFIKNNKKGAIALLDEGIRKNEKGIISYLLKERFDVFEFFSDVEGMEESLELLRSALVKQEMDDFRLNSIVIGREALLDAHKGKDKATIEFELLQNKMLSKNAVKRIYANVEKICDGQSIMY